MSTQPIEPTFAFPELALGDTPPPGRVSAPPRRADRSDSPSGLDPSPGNKIRVPDNLVFEGGDDQEREERTSFLAVWNTDVAKRQRVLLHALPLFRLHHADSIVGGRGGEFSHYDAFALTLRVFDLIIENTGLENEPETHQLGEALVPTLTAMDVAVGIEPCPDRHARMAEWVMKWLLNEDPGHREPHRVPYTAFDDQGRAKRRNLNVTLLTERYMPGDRIVPRLSPELTNLYLSALDLTIEDQQIAVETVMKAQIRRGRFSEAVRSARQAHALSVQYREQIEAILRATRRDAVRVDWREEVPTLLDNARDHIEERTRTERQIRQGAEDKLNALTMGGPEARQLAEVIKLVDRCFQQHTALLRRLILALPTFLDEQARQAFVPQYARSAPDLQRDVLEPFMALRQAVALEHTDDLLSQFVPPRVPGVLSLRELVEWHFRPRAEGRSHTVPVPERNLQEVKEEPLRFSPDDWDRAAAVLGGVAEPVRLSALLEELRGNGLPPIVLDLVVLRALFVFAPGEEGGDGDGLCAEKSGEMMSWGHYYGDDLILYRIPEDEAR